MDGLNDSTRCDQTLSSNKSVEHLYSSFEQVNIIIIVPIITLIGLLGNTTLLYTFCRIQPMRTITNFYLGNLALADSILLISGTIQWLCSYGSSPIYYNYAFSFSTRIGCVLPDFLVYLSYFVSVFIVTIVTVERYLALCRPFQQYQSQGYNRALKLSTIAWITSAVFAACRLPQWPQTYCLQWPEDDPQYDGYPTTVPICDNWVEWSLNVTVYIDMIQYFLALSIVSYTSFAMMKRLKQRSQIILTDNVSRTKIAKDRNKITCMLITNATIFFLCLTPFEILNADLLMSTFTTSRLSLKVSNIISWIGRTTMFINSACNPIVYSIIHYRYRKAFLEAWGCDKFQIIAAQQQSQLRFNLSGRSTFSTQGHLVENNTSVVKCSHGQWNEEEDRV